MSPKPEYSVPTMTVEAATSYAQQVHEYVTAQTRDEDEVDGAYSRFEQHYGVGRWTVDHLRKGKAKTCDVGVFARLRAAYLDMCRRQVSKLQLQIARDEATGNDTDQDLADRLRAIAEEIEAKRAAVK